VVVRAALAATAPPAGARSAGACCGDVGQPSPPTRALQGRFGSFGWVWVAQIGIPGLVCLALAGRPPGFRCRLRRLPVARAHAGVPRGTAPARAAHLLRRHPRGGAGRPAAVAARCGRLVVARFHVPLPRVHGARAAGAGAGAALPAHQLLPPDRTHRPPLRGAGGPAGDGGRRRGGPGRGESRRLRPPRAALHRLRDRSRGGAHGAGSLSLHLSARHRGRGSASCWATAACRSRARSRERTA
jgi:hypothetical protein